MVTGTPSRSARSSGLRCGYVLIAVHRQISSVSQKHAGVLSSKSAVASGRVSTVRAIVLWWHTTTGHPEPKRPHRVIAERIKEVRAARGLTGAQLAEKMTQQLASDGTAPSWPTWRAAGAPAVSVEELLALAFVLDVAPGALDRAALTRMAGMR